MWPPDPFPKLPDPLPQLRALSKLTGKRVTVVNAKGEAHELPLAGQAEAAKVLADLDLQIRTTMGVVASIAANLNEVVNRAEKVLSAVDNELVNRAEKVLIAVESAAQRVVIDQAEVARSIAALNATLAQPIQPVYSAKGILLGAKRVAKLETK